MKRVEVSENFMKIVFVYPAYHSLAFEYLSAIAKGKGHEVAMVFDPSLFNDSYFMNRRLSHCFSFADHVADEIIKQKPDLIAFSVVTTDYPWFQDISKRIRKRTNAPIIAGNVHVTAVPEESLKSGCVDAVVRGEGEGAFADIIDSLEKGGIASDIPNVCVMRDGEPVINVPRPPIPDLDSLPLPDKDIYAGTPLARSEMYCIMTARGCPFNCTFCSNNLLRSIYGGMYRVRTRSAANVLSELEWAKERQHPRFISFLDLTLGTDSEWFEEFTEKYPEKIGIPYFISTNPGIVTETYAERLASSGCVYVDIGVQTVNETLRRDVFHRNETNDDVRHAVERLRKHGMRVGIEHITNFPGETEEDLITTAIFYNEVRPDSLKMYWLYYFPGTQIVDIALKYGNLTKEEVNEINAGRQIGSPMVYDAGSRLRRKLFVLISLIPLLPKGVVSYILSRGLYHYVPYMWLHKIIYYVARKATRISPEFDILLSESMRRYSFYLRKWAALRLGYSAHK